MRSRHGPARDTGARACRLLPRPRRYPGPVLRKARARAGHDRSNRARFVGAGAGNASRSLSFDRVEGESWVSRSLSFDRIGGESWVSRSLSFDRIGGEGWVSRSLSLDRVGGEGWGEGGFSP